MISMGTGKTIIFSNIYFYLISKSSFNSFFCPCQFFLNMLVSTLVSRSVGQWVVVLNKRIFGACKLVSGIFTVVSLFFPLRYV